MPNPEISDPADSPCRTGKELKSMSAVETSLQSGSGRWAPFVSLLNCPLLPLLLILTVLFLLPATLSAQAEETQSDDSKAPLVVNLPEQDV